MHPPRRDAGVVAAELRSAPLLHRSTTLDIEPADPRCPDAPSAERCRSGRTGRSRKPLSWQQFPGFESLSLRHQVRRVRAGAASLQAPPFFRWFKRRARSSETVYLQDRHRDFETDPCAATCPLPDLQASVVQHRGTACADGAQFEAGRIEGTRAIRPIVPACGPGPLPRHARPLAVAPGGRRAIRANAYRYRFAWSARSLAFCTLPIVLRGSSAAKRTRLGCL